MPWSTWSAFEKSAGAGAGSGPSECDLGVGRNAHTPPHRLSYAPPLRLRRLNHILMALAPGLAYTVIFGYSYMNIHYCIHIHIRISIYSVYNIQTAWCQVLSSFVKFTMHSRAPIPVYILGRFCSYMYIHYTPTLQNILYTTYMPTLRPGSRLPKEHCYLFDEITSYTCSPLS